MNTMMYKGYVGEVEYDDEYKIFSGSVINTRTVITFQGASVEELNKEFQLSVDDYLEWCKEDGIDPEKAPELFTSFMQLGDKSREI